MDGKLIVSSSPHISSPVKTKNIMLDVIIAMVPALLASVYFFGPRALALVVITVAACVISEFISRKVMKREQTIGDLSAVVTGMLLAFNYPATLPFWIAALGGVVAIVFVKQMFGGLGHNFANPAITARVILLTSFALRMTTWVDPHAWKAGAVDGVSAATTLGMISSGNTADLPTYAQMLIGERAGCLGETCIIGLLIGGIYLVAKKVISPIIPACFIGTVFAFAAIYYAVKGDYNFIMEDHMMVVDDGGYTNDDEENGRLVHCAVYYKYKDMFYKFLTDRICGER